MSLSIKPGARIFGKRPEMVYAAIVVVGVFDDMGFKAVLTCASNGKHSDGSFHYNGLADDYRMNHIPLDRQSSIKEALASALGPDFDVLLESAGTPNAHCHVEFQPKTGVNL